MDQRLWKCVNRYRVRTDADKILKKAKECVAELEGIVLYSHIAGKVDGDELEELNENRAVKEMRKLTRPFYALTLHDVRLVGEENEDNKMFREYLDKRIKLKEGRGQQQENTLYLLSWISAMEVRDEKGEKQSVEDEELIGRRVRIVVKNLSRKYHPGYVLKKVTLLEGEPLKDIASEKKKEIMRQVLENNKKISELMQTNMNVLLESGLRSKDHDPYFDFDKDKISFPKGYVGNKSDYEEMYRLKEFIRNERIRNNVAYALQLSDVYCFLDNYIYTYGSVQMALKKAAFINLVGVMEAFVLSAISGMRGRCGDCKQKCIYTKFNSDDRTFYKCIVNIKELDLFGWEAEDYEFMKSCNRLRNSIHLASKDQEKAEKNMTNCAEEFDRMHEQVIDFLGKLADAICENLAPGMDECLRDYKNSSV